MNNVTKFKNVNVNTPWRGLGVDCKEAKSLQEVLDISNLNFTVEQKDVIVNGNKVPNYIANMRSDTEQVLGIVGSRYHIINNQEAFSFIDGMVEEGMKFHMANASADSKKVWILGELEDINILGDDITPYIYFENSFDGSGSIKLNVVMLRQWCANGMTYMMKHDNFSWSIKHTAQVMNRLQLAHDSILKANKYISKFENEMEKLADTKLDNIVNFSEFLFPTPTDASSRKEENVAKLRNEIISVYNNKVDIQPFKGTQYGAYMAVTDLASHSEPLRQTSTASENRFFNLVKGNEWVGKAQEYFRLAS